MFVILLEFIPVWRNILAEGLVRVRAYVLWVDAIHVFVHAFEGVDHATIPYEIGLSFTCANSI